MVSCQLALLGTTSHMPQLATAAMRQCGSTQSPGSLGVCVSGMCRPTDLRSCSGFKDLGPLVDLISVATCLIEPLLAVPPSDHALSIKLSCETRTFLHRLELFNQNVLSII
jgi:hypothetical protein